MRAVRAVRAAPAVGLAEAAAAAGVSSDSLVRALRQARQRGRCCAIAAAAAAAEGLGMPQRARARGHRACSPSATCLAAEHDPVSAMGHGPAAWPQRLAIVRSSNAGHRLRAATLEPIPVEVIPASQLRRYAAVPHAEPIEAIETAMGSAVATAAITAEGMRPLQSPRDWHKLHPMVLAAAAADPSKSMRRIAAEDPGCPQCVLAGLASDHDVGVRDAVARNTNTPPSALEALADDADIGVCLDVISEPQLPARGVGSADRRQRRQRSPGGGTRHRLRPLRVGDIGR